MIIDQKKIDEAIDTIVAYGGEYIRECVQCGACSAVCPGVRAGFPLLCRNLIRHLLNGQLEEIIEDSSSWGCQACSRCTEVCPQGVRPQEVVFAFRRYQANQLAFSTSSVTSQMNLFETGHAVYVDPKEARKKVGLPETTPTSAFDEQAKQEIQTLINNSPMGQLGLF
ncbi:MAG: 4Fe-4S dicluster domain-containing protein [Desulfobulbus sp.]|jgi:heterodisulfide reductase subunit C|uniref:4Fe-4S dicluster domain-containing protein n=1 Tax=Desulfobulbus sp. TaxID=895 RepID=UPI002840926C|nr:4Fe-4S dicluster domain-containing protein [Desulfobulbus sp.]MDR2551223.1 4Fe-4S dicluster domain-containing protein [Desulfobulbus sp.]